MLLICGATQESFAQIRRGKNPLETEKIDPPKMDLKKVKTSKRSKITKWDWSKIMWFKARKSDYETKKYNPDKRPKRKVYNEKPEIRSESRKPGEGAVELKTPLIPYDTRVAEKGPILQKKNKAKKPSGKDVGPRVDVPIIGIIRPEETLQNKKKDKTDRKVDGKRLYTAKESDRPKPYDFDELESSKRKSKPTKLDNDKLMNFQVADKPKPYDDDKLMYITKEDPKKQEVHGKRLLVSAPEKPKKRELHDDRLLVAAPEKPKKAELHDDRLMITVPKIERSKLHDERLLTVKERQYPSSTMKRITEDIAKYDGDYKITTKKGKDYHPSSRHLSASRHGIPWLRRTQQSLSMFWSKIWPWDLQPSSVTEKKPKLRRDKKEGQIWDTTVHPDEWNKKPEQAESGEEQ